MEFFVVLAFGVGWAILEWRCKQLDKQRDQEKQVSDQRGDKPV